MPETIGSRLRAKRIAKGLSIGEVARLLGGKNDKPAVYLYESGKRIPTSETIARFARIYGCEPADIDPKGEAYNPAVRAPRRTRDQLQKSRTRADSVSVAPTEEAGVLMESGLPPVPDPELFGELLGVWRLLRGSEERRAFVEHARGYLGITPARHASSATKKARR